MAIQKYQQAMGALEISTVSVADYNPLAIAIAGMQSAVNLITSSSVQDAIARGDNPNATADGSGSIDGSDFVNVGGVCKPRNFPALRYVQELQRQMNRVAQAKGWSKVGVDGEVGPSVLALLKKIQSVFPQVMGNASSCAYIAADADVIGDQVKGVANSLGAPATVVGAAAKAATIVTKSGLTVTAPGPAGASAMDAFGGMSTGQTVVFAGLLGGIGYVLYKKSKKGKRR